MVSEVELVKRSGISDYSRIIAFISMIAPFIVMAGWALDNRLLITWDMLGPPMNPLSAICVFLSGTVLFLFSSGNLKWVSIISWMILFLVVFNLIAGISGFYFDQILFNERILARDANNHMAYHTSFSFAVLAISFAASSNGRYRLSQILSLLILFISLSVFVAYIYAGHPIWFKGTPMALNTSLILILLSSGSLLLYTNKGYAIHIMGNATGAVLSRRFIPLALLFVLGLGFLRERFVQDDIPVLDIGLAIIVSTTIMVFLVVIYYFSSIVNKTENFLEDEKRRVTKLNHKLHDKNKELEKRNEELERFALSLTHDIRSPLSGIMNTSSKLLEDGFSEKERNEFLELIKTTSGSVIDKANQMLELAKASRKPLKKTPVNSGFVISEVLNEIKAGTSDKQIQVEMKSLPVVMADKTLLKSVFYNLISNAVKYSRGKVSRIVINCQHKGREKIFSVKDNGIGLDVKSITRLFKSFSRLTATESIPGTGLGLSIVKRIVERHGGKVWAKPGDKGGAVFYFSLPS